MEKNDVVDQIMIAHMRALSEHIKRYIGKDYTGNGFQLKHTEKCPECGGSLIAGVEGTLRIPNYTCEVKFYCDNCSYAAMCDIQVGVSRGLEKLPDEPTELPAKPENDSNNKDPQ